MSNDSNDTTKGPALIFGASGEQGRAVVEGMVDVGYYPVYAFCGFEHHHANSLQFSPTPRRKSSDQTYLTDALGATLITGDLQNPDHVLNALTTTKAAAIFVVTTTELPAADSEMGRQTEYGFSDAMEAEYQVICTFFHLLKQAFEQDGIRRHVVLSTRDNVQAVVRAHLQQQSDNKSEKEQDVWIQALEDGSIVPHYSAKGRGAEYAQQYLADCRDDLKLTLLTMPFMYSNFLGFFAPLPDETRTQWTLSACFGNNPIDMMGAQDLAVLVPNIFANPDLYNGKNLRLVGERITMDQVAAVFEDLYGKPVIYNPLTVQEVAAMPFAAAPAMAQMCQFVGDPRSLQHDLQATQEAMGTTKKPQKFEDWLLTHSESSAFQESGLTLDAPEITSVTVFGATSPEGTSVVKGLLADKRKKYTIRATSRHIKSDRAQAVYALAPDRIQLVQVDLDDIKSCTTAVEGVDGVFLVTHFLQEDQSSDAQVEERHMRHVIDACEAAHSVRHVVFSTLESADVIRHMQLSHDMGFGEDDNSSKKHDAAEVQFGVRARGAAYARTKKLSVTFVLLPYYSERFFDMLKQSSVDGKQKIVLDVDKQDTKVVCMSIDALGEAVANIFDSYQVYSGHEIGLVTDLVSYSDVKEIVEKVVVQTNTEEDSSGNKNKTTMEVETTLDEDVKWEDSGLEPKDTYMKDLGQMFGHLAHSDAVRMRRSVAKTMQLVPSALPLREWIEQNMNNEAFREKLGLR